ncbi:MAG TPA: L-fuculose-phosphate aldolase [Clostridiaceae bacterium]|nr:L-fuculose-phosphate aldolase [Clostridiaceae bacterium]
MLLVKEREQLVAFGKKLITSDLTTGSGGNISIFNRDEGLIAITPSGMDYFETEVDDILVVNIDGEVVEGKHKPSSETGMHLAFYKERPDANAVVHTHSLFATAVSCMGWTLEPVHYMVAMAGFEVPCAEYAVYGSMELARNAVKAMGDRNAVLLANHGLIALGSDVQSAFSTAEHLEYVAKLYCICKTLGEPNILTKDQMLDVMKKFKTYRYR